MVGSSVEIYLQDETFSGLFFQDSLMKSAFRAFPELLLVDATYKLNDLRMPLYLMMIVDGNGNGEIVSLYLTSYETENAISQMVKTFKEHNPDWASTKVIITDKDFNERAVFKHFLYQLKELLIAHLL